MEVNHFQANVRTVGEALLAYVLNLPNTKCVHEENISTCSILSPGDVNTKRLSNWLQHFGSKPRPLAGNSEWLVANLRDAVARYVITGRIDCIRKFEEIGNVVLFCFFLNVFWAFRGF